MLAELERKHLKEITCLERKKYRMKGEKRASAVFCACGSKSPTAAKNGNKEGMTVVRHICNIVWLVSIISFGKANSALKSNKAEQARSIFFSIERLPIVFFSQDMLVFTVLEIPKEFDIKIRG